MFAIVLETEYPSLKDVPTILGNWLHLWGWVAIVALILAELFRQLLSRGSILRNGLSGRLANLDESQEWKLRTFWLLLIVAAGGLAASGLMTLMTPWLAARGLPKPGDVTQEQMEALLASATALWTRRANQVFVWVGCLAAVLAVSWEFLLDLAYLSPRRVWAIARLSIKESIRRKALWSFCILLLLFLFASWFIRTDRPEYQWRVYVDLLFFVVAALVLLTASVLACFSLPTDIKLQTIHTIVTKPVQRFEIIAGRILGFSLLMTVVLVIIAHLSLLYVFRGLDASARETTMRARVPIFGDLRFETVDDQGQVIPTSEGVNVGREWTYRQYVRGGSTQEAIWSFPALPANLAREKRMIPIELSFDIFRTTKGGDDYKEGVSTQIAFVNRDKWNYGRYADYRQNIDSRTTLAKDPYELAREFGYYELRSPLTMVDYETYVVSFPSTLLEGAGPGAFEIRVACRSLGQYLGVAKYDLYVLANEGNFYLNYLKGVTSIWFLMVLLVSLGVVFSTYLNALVGLLLTWFMVLLGAPVMRMLITGLSMPVHAENNPGGGAFESLYRLVKQMNLVVPLEEQNRGVWLLLNFDEGLRYFFKVLLAILPDLHQFWRTTYVAEGFNIPGSEILASALLLAAYLFPFLVGGYYVLNVREIAK